MPWYKTGTVSVAQNSNAVTGSNTSFIANSRVGDAFLGPDGRWYEVTNIASDTAMAISPNYLGATTSTGTYALAPMQGYVKDSADALRALVNQLGTKLAALGTTGNYDILPVTKGGTGATTAAAALAALGAVGLGVDNNSAGTFFASGEPPGIAAISSSGKDGRTALRISNGANAGASSVMTFIRDGIHAIHFGLDTDNKLKVGGFSMGAVARTLYHEGNAVGPVSQSGGVPTGAIIERGSNASGFWTKYADGTLECWGNISGLDQTVANQPYSKGVGFPVNFADTNYVVMVNVDSLNVSNVFAGYARAGRGNVSSFSLIQCWSYVQTYVYTYYAKGRWFL